MSGYCDDCGNTLCVCSAVAASRRTVLDAAQCGECSCSDALKCLGIDPEMPIQQLERWLRYGKNVETQAIAHGLWSGCMATVIPNDEWGQYEDDTL